VNAWLTVTVRAPGLPPARGLPIDVPLTMDDDV
jgi:hypothetical protein